MIAVLHTLCHTYASWLVQNGVDLYTVQKLMGHSTIAMTEKYAHLAPDNLKAAVRVLEKSLEKIRVKVKRPLLKRLQTKMGRRRLDITI